MSEVLFVNPRRRRRKARKSAPRKRAKRRRNPGFSLPAVNPRRRKRRASGRRRRVSFRRRRNPALRLSVGGIQGQVMGAVPGAVGALALDVVMGYLPLPANLKGGMLSYVVKGAAAVGLGMLASKVVKPATAAKMTEGALTVMLHGVLKTMTSRFAPQIAMGEYEGAGWEPSEPLGAYLDNQAGLPNVEASPVGAYMDMGAYEDTDYM